MAAEHLGDVVDPGALETVKLLISELVTNCVRHAHLEAGDGIDLRVILLPATVRAEVTAPGPAFDRPPPAALRVMDTGGRGLEIVDVLSERWGIRAGVNSVWFEVATTDSA
jgi:anti-sigma regulatory factor (Ser/Thr protein kinase)